MMQIQMVMQDQRVLVEIEHVEDHDGTIRGFYGTVFTEVKVDGDYWEGVGEPHTLGEHQDVSGAVTESVNWATDLILELVAQAHAPND